jgi:hypothetical protein
MTTETALISSRMSRIAVKWGMIVPLDMMGIMLLLRLVQWGCVSTCVLADTPPFSTCVSIITLIHSIAVVLEISAMLRIKRYAKMEDVFSAMSVMGLFKAE